VPTKNGQKSLKAAPRAESIKNPVEVQTKDFAISRAAMVGDRGMISTKAITVLKQTDGLDWITALRSSSIKKLLPNEGFSFGLFDEKNICEFTAPEEYLGERLIACRNPVLQYKRRAVRDKLLKLTEEKLDKIQERIKAGRLKKADAISSAVSKIFVKYKMKKHFLYEVKEGYLEYSLNHESIDIEKMLDGIYVIRTSLPVEVLNKEDCVRQYKNLAQEGKSLQVNENSEPEKRAELSLFG
jgi:hypothetical protein